MLMVDKPHILIVEDDPQIIQFLQSSLKANGYVTLSAQTIGVGKKLVSENKLSLLIVDLSYQLRHPNISSVSASI